MAHPLVAEIGQPTVVAADPIMTEALEEFADKVSEQSKEIIALSDNINADLWKLTTAKRAKVTKYEGAQRKLKNSAEFFHEYLRETDSLFEYLQKKELVTKIKSDLEEDNPKRDSLEALLEQLQRSVERTRTAHTAFNEACQRTEDKCQKGASQCQAYTVRTEKKKYDREKTGRTLAINQLLIGAGGVVSFIIFIVLIANGTVTFNAGTASALVISLIISISTITIGVAAVVLVTWKSKHYKTIGKKFLDMEEGFKGLDERVYNMKYLLLSSLHSHVLTVEGKLNDSKELLKEEVLNVTMLIINLDILVSKSEGYISVSQRLHKELRVFFGMRHKLNGKHNQVLPLNPANNRAERESFKEDGDRVSYKGSEDAMIQSRPDHIQNEDKY